MEHDLYSVHEHLSFDKIWEHASATGSDDRSPNITTGTGGSHGHTGI